MSDRKAAVAPRVAVVGSINMDLVIECQRLPRPGETIHGKSLQELPGGKGANQAVAAARLGAAVTLVGRVGDDAFAPRLLANLRQENVGIDFVLPTSAHPSGVAIVAVEESGENSITIIAGANGKLSSTDVRAAANEIAAADVLLLQLEIPAETVLAAINTAKSNDTIVVLDPAPAPTDALAEMLDVDFLCPNETESALITGLPVETDEQAQAAAARLCEMGARCAIITRGQRGSLVHERGGPFEFVSSVPVDAVDTTAAGDAFAAAFAVRISEGATSVEAARYACRAGSAAASRLGAQIAMPTRDEVARMSPA